ncbi:MAG: DUF1653 domain-containing protein [Actinomycetes bacterium]
MHVVPGIYTHYKGSRYRVLGLVHDANEQGRAAVLYVPLYAVDGPLHAVRSVDDFLAEVAPGVPRFRHLPEADPPSAARTVALRDASDVRDEDVDAVARRVATLDLVPRAWRCSALSLRVLDAVFSPNARYDTVGVTVDRYATWAGIERARVARGAVSAEQPLDEFVRQVDELGVEPFAASVLRNRQRTRTSRDAPLKADAALAFARALLHAGVRRLDDLAAWRHDASESSRLDAELSRLPGAGDGQRLAHFHALAGDDAQVVTGRHLVTWLEAATAATVTPTAARVLVTRAASALAVNPWEVGDAVWRSRRAVAGATGAPPGPAETSPAGFPLAAEVPQGADVP